jgi:hypothetical protein
LAATTDRRQRGQNPSGGDFFNKIRAFLFLAAITIYVLSNDLSWRPSSPASVAEAEYSSKIVGDWQGRVEGTKETISFGADGGFVSTVQPQGFIGRTLGQGVTGTIRGNWTIKGKTITLNINSAEDERALNSVATATIETFKPNELIVRCQAHASVQNSNQPRRHET